MDLDLEDSLQGFLRFMGFHLFHSGDCHPPCRKLNFIQPLHFPSWQSKSVGARGGQSEAASKAEGFLGETALEACAPRPEAQHHGQTE